MDIEIVARPGAAAARLKLHGGEAVTAEVGAMIAMSDGFQVETTTATKGKGSLLGGLKRMFSGENFFLNHFTATADGQELVVGPTGLGDIVHHRLTGGTLVVQGSSWLASSHGITIDTTWQGLTSAVFSGEGIFWVKCSGEGDVLVNSFGGIYEVEVDDAGYVVDTGHIVAFDDTLKFAVGKASQSLIGSFLGGEGLVCKFSGRGKLYCQSHNPPSFGKLLGPKLKPR
ncbi:MAG: TIGR00266 family protein [Polyangiales bacterium]